MCSEQQVGADRNQEKPTLLDLARLVCGKKPRSLHEHSLGGRGGTTELRKCTLGCAPLYFEKRRTPQARPLMHALNPKP